MHECIVAIETLWERSQRNFLTIGRYLIAAKKKLPHGEYDAMILDKLPFSRNTAHMFRTVAESLENRTIEPEALPRDYSAAYKLVTLQPAQLEQARSRDLVRPTLTRKEIDSFRREFTSTTTRMDGLPKSDKALLKARRKLIDEMETIRRKIAEIDERLGTRIIEGTSRVLASDEGSRDAA